MIGCYNQGLIQFHLYWARSMLFDTSCLMALVVLVYYCFLMLRDWVQVFFFFFFCEAWGLRTSEILEISLCFTAQLSAIQMVEYLSLLSTKIDRFFNFQGISFGLKTCFKFCTPQKTFPLDMLPLLCFHSFPGRFLCALDLFPQVFCSVSIFRRWFLCSCERPQKP